MVERVYISHWLPILTICPVNKLPDLVYATVITEDQFMELYSVRKRIRKLLSWRHNFMEDLARDLLNEFPLAKEVRIELLTGRHKVHLKREA